MHRPRADLHPTRRQRLTLSGPIVTRSLLYAQQEAVWRRISTAAGINDELRPLFRMTAPARLRRDGLAAVQVGQRVCRSIVLLGGLLPIDYDDITLQRLDPPNGFLERSQMLSQRIWQHERCLESHAEGCLLTDRVSYEPRLALADRPLRGLYTGVFDHRHRRLRRHFGGRAMPPHDDGA